MREHIIKKIIFPLASLSPKYRFYKMYKNLEKEQWLTPKQLENISFRKLRQTIQHAYTNIPMYQKLYNAASVTPDILLSSRDIQKFPITTKSFIRNHFPQKAVDKDSSSGEWIYNSTSGSTGTPFEFIMDQKLKTAKMARAFLHLDWAGIKPGEKYIKLWGQHKEETEKSFTTKHILRRKELPCFDLHDHFHDYVKIINTYKPKAIEAYTSALVKFARLAQEHTISVNFPTAIVSAETLYEKDRALIEKTFQCNIFNRYGSREFGSVMQECPEHHNLHVFSTNFFVEIVNEDGQWVSEGEQGKLIITNFDNKLMPLIRYDTGDLATHTQKLCKCGRGFPLVQSINGRETDFVKTKTGKLIPFLYFNYFFEQYGSFIIDFQIVIDKQSNLTVTIIPAENFSKTICQRIQNELENEFKDELNIKITEVASIRLSKSGKKRLVIENDS